MSKSSSDPGPLPKRWLNCPRKATSLIAHKFLAFKTPLSERFDGQVEMQYRFPPSMILESKQFKVNYFRKPTPNETSSFIKFKTEKIDFFLDM